MRQAQQWIEQNVPKTDRLIVDDAFWVDLVRDGRDRRNVVWAYKVDTDEQVQDWAPDGWTDYEWVVSTASLRANMAPTGVLTDAVAHSQPAATFGSGGTSRGAPCRQWRTDLETPVARGAGVRRATRGPPCRCHRSGCARGPAVSDGGSTCAATLAVIAATQPVRVEDISTIEGEDDTGTPRRDITLTRAATSATRCGGILRTPSGPVRSAVRGSDRRGTESSISVAHQGYRSRRKSGAAAGSPAALRVADLRRSRPAEQLNLVRIDGTAAGSIETSDDANPSGYRSMPAGTYVVVTNRVGGGDPVIRQVLTLHPGDLHARTVLRGRIQPARSATRTGRPAHRPHARLRRADAARCQRNRIRLPGAGSTRHVEPMVLANKLGTG